MRLLIADKLHPRAIEEARTLPIDVVYEPELTRENLEQNLQGVGILVVRSTEVTASAIEAATHLNLIVRAGASYETIDVRAASRRGIYVANCPGRNASAVAELVYGLMVCLDRRIPDAVASLRAGRWEWRLAPASGPIPRPQRARHQFWDLSSSTPCQSSLLTV